MQISRAIYHVRRYGTAMFPLTGLILFLAPAVQCQRIDPAKVNMQEMDQREMQLNSMGKNAAPADRKRSQAMMDQISQDFDRLLTLHNEIVRTITAKQTFGSQFISDAVGEIRKRSVRLQSALQLSKPEPGAREPQPIDVERMEMNDALILLCQSIEKFVANPIIDKPGTVDAEQLQKARGQLQSVVEISE
ncbi:MAG TPA: hypothetical protein VE863_18570, partial [Pyrinomonadaceae bacterium]|nr:hypothetical protein [Pyrinomonadaceae bacterium]